LNQHVEIVHPHKRIAKVTTLQAAPKGLAPAQVLSRPALQKALLKLHATVELEGMWKAAVAVLDIALPQKFIVGLFQFIEMERPMILKFSQPLPGPPDDLKRFFEVCPTWGILQANPGLKLWRVSDDFDDERWEQTEFYRDFVRHQGWYYGALLVFWKGKRILGTLSAQRTREQGDFSDAEMRLLACLHPHFNAAVQRLDMLHTEHTARAAAEQLLRRLPLPTVLLDWNLRLAHSNPAARDCCALWNFGPERARFLNTRDEFRLPPVLLETCQQLKTQWNDKMLKQYALASPAGHPVRHPDSPELRANIHVVQRSTGSITKPIFRIEFEQSPGAEREPREGSRGAAEANLALSARLTRRERELVELICQGAANKDIAGRLCLSVGTVKKELNTLYQKLEVHSRSQLMALMR